MPDWKIWIGCCLNRGTLGYPSRRWRHSICLFCDSISVKGDNPDLVNCDLGMPSSYYEQWSESLKPLFEPLAICVDPGDERL